MANNYTGELLHFNAVRMRVVGEGTLRTTMRSLDDVNNATLPTITLASLTNREPTILANFRDQRAQVEVKMTGINEYFNISRIIVYHKQLASGYPQL